MTEEVTNLIAEARNPLRHSGDSHCPACSGSCGAWADERAGDPEELILRLAVALERSATETREARQSAWVHENTPNGGERWTHRREAPADAWDEGARYISEANEIPWTGFDAAANPYRPVAVVPEDPKPTREQELVELESLEDGWNGEGSFAPGPEVFRNVRALSEVIPESWDCTPNTNGTMSFERPSQMDGTWNYIEVGRTRIGAILGGGDDRLYINAEITQPLSDPARYGVTPTPDEVTPEDIWCRCPGCRGVSPKAGA